MLISNSYVPNADNIYGLTHTLIVLPPSNAIVDGSVSSHP